MNPFKKPFTRGVERCLVKDFIAKVKTKPLYQSTMNYTRSEFPTFFKNSSQKILIFNDTSLNGIANQFYWGVDIKLLLNHGLVVRYCFRTNIKS